jgi:hypothetical protein
MYKTKTSESNMYEAVMSETPMSKMLECPNQVSDVMVLDIFISDILPQRSSLNIFKTNYILCRYKTVYYVM